MILNYGFGTMTATTLKKHILRIPKHNRHISKSGEQVSLSEASIFYTWADWLTDQIFNAPGNRVT